MTNVNEPNEAERDSLADALDAAAARQQAWGRLYTAANQLCAYMGYHGSVDARSDLGSLLMDALHELDGGQWMPGLMPVAVEPGGAQVAPAAKPPSAAGIRAYLVDALAMELAEADGHEGDDKHRLIWSGGAVPEPEGEVWQRYTSQASRIAQRALEMAGAWERAEDEFVAELRDDCIRERDEALAEVARLRAALAAEPVKPQEPARVTSAMTQAALAAVVPGKLGRTVGSYLPAESAPDMMDLALRAALAADPVKPQPTLAPDHKQEPVARMFPIMGKTLTSVPWSLLAPHEAQAVRNHSQSLERLAQRGGLSACEALAVIEGRKWGDIKPQPDDESRLAAIAVKPPAQGAQR
jgi:hypothetical protein